MGMYTLWKIVGFVVTILRPNNNTINTLQIDEQRQLSYTFENT